jgi:hypothetical protein
MDSNILSRVSTHIEMAQHLVEGMDPDTGDSALAMAIQSLVAEARLLKQAIERSRAAPVPKKKREPNTWVRFTQRVARVLKAAAAATAIGASKHMAFCSALKGMRAYDDWTDEAIVEQFSAWRTTEAVVTIVNEPDVVVELRGPPVSAWSDDSVVGAVDIPGTL